MGLSALRAWLGRLREHRREHGWRGLVRHFGWKPILILVLFYLVRDVILYVLIPLAIWVGLFR